MTQRGGSAQVDMRAGGIVGGGYTLRAAGVVEVDPPSIALGATGEYLINIANNPTDYIVCQVGDIIFMTPPSSMENGLNVEGIAVTATDVVTVRITNTVSTDPEDGAKRSWAYVIFAKN